MIYAISTAKKSAAWTLHCAAFAPPLHSLKAKITAIETKIKKPSHTLRTGFEIWNQLIVWKIKNLEFQGSVAMQSETFEPEHVEPGTWTF